MEDNMEDINKALWVYFDKPERFYALWHLRSHMPKEKLIQDFGSIWQQSESQFQDQEVIKNLFEFIGLEGSALWNTIMDKDDRAEFQKLRARGSYIRVYRGCWEANREGWSWTTYKSIAEKFAKRHAPDGFPIVMSGKVRLENVVAYFNGREEKEIVVQPHHVEQLEGTVLPYQKPSSGKMLFQAVQAGNFFTPEHKKETTICFAKMDPTRYLPFLTEQLEFYKKYNFTERAKLYSEIIDKVKAA